MVEFNPIQPIKPVDFEKAFTLDEVEAEPKGADAFQNVLNKALGGANESFTTVEALSKQLATGELKNLHDLTIAQSKAEVMLRLTTQIASKLATAATTLFQMQL